MPSTECWPADIQSSAWMWAGHHSIEGNVSSDWDVLLKPDGWGSVPHPFIAQVSNWRPSSCWGTTSSIWHCTADSYKHDSHMQRHDGTWLSKSWRTASLSNLIQQIRWPSGVNRDRHSVYIQPPIEESGLCLLSISGHGQAIHLLSGDQHTDSALSRRPRRLVHPM